LPPTASAAEHTVREQREVIEAARAEHRRVETVNADGDDWEGCICGEAWDNCKTSLALSEYDATEGPEPKEEL